MNRNEIMISIVCTTYNHDAYIKEAIEGFLMQKTTFPVEIIIHDDASTDKTAEIIRYYAQKHPDKIFATLQEKNQFNTGIGVFKTYIWPKVRGKYVALCEGDDYWSDPFKLQRQVDFLEANPMYGMVCTDFDTKDGNTIFSAHLYHNRNMKKDEDITVEKYLLRLYTIRTLTVCFRSELIRGYVDLSEKNRSSKISLVGDVPLWLYIASKSKIRFLSYPSSVYRITPNSASRQDTFAKRYKFSKSVIQTKRQFIENYPVTLRVKRKIEKADL